MSIRHFFKRLLFYVAVVWVALTITFFIPRLSTRNPVRERFAELSISGGFSPQDLEKIIEAFSVQFGLDKPLPEQYVSYMGAILRGDLGYSFNQYPARVTTMIQAALPFSLTLLIISAVLSFLIGNLIGALSAWPKTPRWLKGIATPLIIMKGVHPFVFGIVISYIFAFSLKWFPIVGTYSAGMTPGFNFEFIRNVAWHMILPIMSLVLASAGGWALAMRGIGVTIQGEDYVNFAEHKGLQPARIFRGYFVRNAILPQATAFALDLGALLVSGLLVENLYAIQGLGNLLNRAIRVNDFPVIYGIVIFIIIGVSVMMLLTEVLYPLIDPRIKMERS